MSQGRIIFSADPIVENFLTNISAGERSKIINNLVKDFMSTKNGQLDELNKEPIALTSATAGLSELSLLLNSKHRKFPRGQEFSQALIAEIKQAVTVDIKITNKTSPWDDLLNIVSASYTYGYLLLAYHQASGSQLELMLALYGGNLAIPRARLIYERAKTSYPNVFEEWNFEKWLDFLLRGGLIAVNDNICSATNAGEELIRFCLRHQLPLNKAL